MGNKHEVTEPLIAFLDANIVLEGKSLVELPWEEIEATGAIQVLIVPRVMEEIDNKKRDGRLGPHARAFNRLIGESVIQGSPVVLRESNPRVELEMAACSRIPWASYDELDPDDGDSRIVAEAINVRDVDSNRRVLISHDIKPLAYARGRGLPIHKASDAWLRPVEPSPKDKEIQRLKQQVAEFKKDEPTFEVSIEVSDDNPATVYKIRPLSADQEKLVVGRILSRNRLKIQDRSQFTIGLHDYDHSYDRNYERYSTIIIPKFVSEFGEKFEMLFNQRLLTVRIANTGQIRADHMVVSIKTNDGWINEKVVAVSPEGPPAPYPESYLGHLHNQRNIIGHTTVRVGRHEFETTRRAKRSSSLEECCEDFRSGQEYLCEGVIMPSSDLNPVEITVSITAANLRGERVETFTLKKNSTEVPISDLIDLDALKVVGDYPIKKELERLIQLKRRNDIEWDGHVLK